MSETDDLPPARGDVYRVAVVCLGNICRSPMADVVLTDALARAGLAGRVEVTSSGTGDWHVGRPMDDRAAATLAEAGYDPSRHRAQQYDAGWNERDLILVMDSQNRRDVLALGAPGDRVQMFRDFDPDLAASSTARDVPDPYQGGREGFAEVLETVRRTSANLVRLLQRRVERAASGDAGPGDGAGRARADRRD